DHPEVTVHVELRRDDTVLFGNPRPGPGGLPVGTSGKALTLISGGFDSAVAAWQMLRRGLDMDFVLFDLAGAEQVAGVQRVLSALEDGRSEERRVGPEGGRRGGPTRRRRRRGRATATACEP